MADQHVGKKRRKEVREAVNMRRDLRKDMALFLSVFALAAVASIVLSYLAALGVLGDNTFVQFLPMIVVFVIIIILSMRISAYWGRRDAYKQHCKRYNITKEDMKALERGEL